MLSERVLTSALRIAFGRALSLESSDDVVMPGPREDTPYMLYVHVPFCERLCPYCSFNRYPFDEELARRYFERLRREIHIVADMGYDFGSAYFGGGTPTVLVDELTETIDLIRELFSIQEVSCETNPNHLIPSVVEPLADRVQRMSVGVQSFDDGLLTQMDRFGKYGSGREILERLEWADGRFHSLNVDMIFNFPSQTAEMVRTDVERVVESGANQVTFYPLMISPAVKRSLKERVGTVSVQREREYYELITGALEGRFEPGSAWTFSRMGGGMIDEYIVDYEDYVGVGSGSFSYLDGAIYVNTFSLRGYEGAIDAGRTAVDAARGFSRRERMAYRLMMELFGLELDKQAFEASFGVTPERGLGAEVTFLRTAGAFDRDDAEVFTLTPKGRYLLVAMMREFFAGVNAFRDQVRAALPPEERALLFGDGDTCSIVPTTM